MYIHLFFFILYTSGYTSDYIGEFPMPYVNINCMQNKKVHKPVENFAFSEQGVFKSSVRVSTLYHVLLSYDL